MFLKSRMPTLLIAMFVTAAAMVWGAESGGKFTSLGAALGFAIIAIEVALAVNRPFLSDAAAALQADAEASIQASQQNARLMAAVYAWGGLTIFAIYGLSDLWWFHSWQYGSAMGLIGAALFGFGFLLGDKDSQFRTPRSLDATALLAMAQAAAAAAGLGFLIASGKLASEKPDWPANHVFLAGGLAIIFISVASAIVHLRLRRAGRAG